MMHTLRSVLLAGSLIFLMSWISSFQTLSPAPDSSTSKFHPLFSKEAPLKLVLTGDLKTLLRDKSEKREYHQFQVNFEEANGEMGTLPVKMKALGNFRRSQCKLPPLRMNFAKKTTQNT